MNLKKILLISFSIVIVIITIVIVYFINQGSRYYDSACDHMVNIASDTNKVKYLEKWATNKIHEDGFGELLGQRTSVELDFTASAIKESIDLDLDLLDLSGHSVYVSFNRSNEDRMSDFNAVKIESIEVGTARFGVLVDLNAKGALGLEWPAEDIKRLNKITDQSFVICK